MATNNNTQELIPFSRCARSNSQNFHICQDPILLSCGHYACKVCADDWLRYDFIKCDICNQPVNHKSIRYSQNPGANKLFDHILSEKLSDAFNLLCQEFDKKMSYCENIEAKSRELFELKIEFIKGEIELSVESVKIELDKLKQSYFQKLDIYKQDVETIVSNNDLIKPNTDKLAKVLNKMKNDIEIKENMTKESLYAYQKSVIKLNEFINEFEGNIPSIEFHQPSEILITVAGCIGELVYSYPDNEYISAKIMSRIKENKHKNVLVANRYICDICVLPDGNLLACDSNNGLLLVMDQQMQVIRTLSTINGNKYNIICLDTNKIDAIYMTSCEQNCVIKMDLEFNFMSEYCGSGGADQLNIPCGICFSNHQVYVCDNGSKRIRVFDEDLKYICAYPVSYHPWYIKIIKNTACIRDNLSAIHFHDVVDDFQQKHVFDGHNGIIGASNKYFYEYFHKNECIYVYDETGKILDQIKTKGYRFGLNNGSLCLFNKHLMICSRSSYIVKI